MISAETNSSGWSSRTARAEAYAQGTIRNACARIREKGPGERHAELRAAAAGAIGGYVKGGLLDEAEAGDELLGAFVDVAGVARKGKAERLIRDGFAFARETTMDELVGRLAEGTR